MIIWSQYECSLALLVLPTKFYRMDLLRPKIRIASIDIVQILVLGERIQIIPLWAIYPERIVQLQLIVIIEFICSMQGRVK